MAACPWRRTPRAAKSEALVARVGEGEVALTDFETVRQHKNGTLVAVSIAAAPVRDRSGRVVGILVAYTDIGEREDAGAAAGRR